MHSPKACYCIWGNWLLMDCRLDQQKQFFFSIFIFSHSCSFGRGSPFLSVYNKKMLVRMSPNFTFFFYFSNEFHGNRYTLSFFSDYFLATSKYKTYFSFDASVEAYCIFKIQKIIVGAIFNLKNSSHFEATRVQVKFLVRLAMC